MHVVEDRVRTLEDAERIGREMYDAYAESLEEGNYDDWVDADPEARLEMNWTLQAVDQLIAGDLDLTDHEVHSKVGFSVYDGYLIPFDDEASGVLVQSAHEVKHAADFLEAFVGDGKLEWDAATVRSRYGEDGLRAARAALRRTQGFYARARDRQMAVIKFCAMG